MEAEVAVDYTIPDASDTHDVLHVHHVHGFDDDSDSDLTNEDAVDDDSDAAVDDG